MMRRQLAVVTERDEHEGGGGSKQSPSHPGKPLSPRGVGLQTGRNGVGFFPLTTALPKQHKVVSTLGKVIRSTLSRTNHSAHQI